MKASSNLVAVSIASVAFLVGVLVFNATLRSNFNTKRSITVTGSAKQTITSDLGRIRVTVASSGATPAAAYAGLKTEVQAARQALLSRQVPANAITERSPDINPDYVYEYLPNGGSNNRLVGHTARQELVIELQDVQKIQALSLTLLDLLGEGLRVDISGPEYFYSKLADVKIGIQGAATQDAMKRAEQIVGATGQTLGPLINARMGVLQITAPNSTQVEDYGINDVSTIEKEVTGVVNVTFIIE